MEMHTGPQGQQATCDNLLYYWSSDVHHPPIHERDGLGNRHSNTLRHFMDSAMTLKSSLLPHVKELDEIFP